MCLLAICETSKDCTMKYGSFLFKLPPWFLICQSSLILRADFFPCFLYTSLCFPNFYKLMLISSLEIKRCLLLGRKIMINLDSNIKKQRHHFANKGLSSQSCGFSSSHVWMWELDHEESESEVTQLCLTLCYPMDRSPPGSSVHEIFQARILEWVAISFSKHAVLGTCFY